MSVTSQAARIAAIVSDAVKNAEKSGDATGGGWFSPTQCEDLTEAAQEITRLMEAAPAEHEQQLAAAHAESETLRTDRDQLAAARLQVAHLHAALQATEEYLYVAPSPEVAERVKAALAGSESTWLGVLAKARAVVAAAEVARDAASRPGDTAPAAFPSMFETVEALAKALPAP